MHTRSLMAAVLAIAPPLFADDGVRTPVPLSAPLACGAPTTIADVGRTYYEQPTAVLTQTVVALLDTCHVSSALQTRYAVFLFTAQPTPAGKPAVVHLLYDAVRRTLLDHTTLLGVDAATWIYASDERSDTVIVQLSSTPVQNPILGQLGKLASTIVPKLPAAGPQAQPERTSPIFVSVSPRTPLPFKRAIISETDFVDRAGTQLTGTAAFDNQPRTWLVLHAGAGVFAGKAAGASPAKIEDHTYVSDPLSRGATFAGVTVHAPYDRSRPEPSRSERIGIVIAAVLTPSLGIFVGPSYGWRGISVTAGWAEMFVGAPSQGRQIGDPVEDHEALATGRAGRVLIGVGYGFGG